MAEEAGSTADAGEDHRLDRFPAVAANPVAEQVSLPLEAFSLVGLNDFHYRAFPWTVACACSRIQTLDRENVSQSDRLPRIRAPANC